MTAACRACSCLVPNEAACRMKTRRWPFWRRSRSVATLVLHSADIQQTLESLNRELRDKVEKITEQQRRILILQDQLRDRAGRERDGSGPPPARRLNELPGETMAEGDSGPFASIRGGRARPFER